MSNEKMNEFIKSAKKATKKAASTTMELADIASLNLKLQGQSVKLSEKYEKLGKLSYDKLANEADNAEKIAAVVAEIGKPLTVHRHDEITAHDPCLLGRRFRQNADDLDHVSIGIKDHVDPADGKAIKSMDENGKLCRFDVFTEESEAWAQTFYSALYQHFKEKGWLSMLFMHLQDEPHTTQYWQWAREKCRVYMPDVPCGEPLDMHSVATQMDGYFDLYIPRVDIYHEDIQYYKEKQRKY